MLRPFIKKTVITREYQDLCANPFVMDESINISTYLYLPINGLYGDDINDFRNRFAFKRIHIHSVVVFDKDCYNHFVHTLQQKRDWIVKLSFDSFVLCINDDTLDSFAFTGLNGRVDKVAHHSIRAGRLDEIAHNYVTLTKERR